jgi:hypothetical protein
VRGLIRQFGDSKEVKQKLPKRIEISENASSLEDNG